MLLLAPIAGCPLVVGCGFFRGRQAAGSLPVGVLMGKRMLLGRGVSFVLGARAGGLSLSV